MDRLVMSLFMYSTDTRIWLTPLKIIDLKSKRKWTKKKNLLKFYFEPQTLVLLPWNQLFSSHTRRQEKCVDRIASWSSKRHCNCHSNSGDTRRHSETQDIRILIHDVITNSSSKRLNTIQKVNNLKAVHSSSTFHSLNEENNLNSRQQNNTMHCNSSVEQSNRNYWRNPNGKSLAQA